MNGNGKQDNRKNAREQKKDTSVAWKHIRDLQNPRVYLNIVFAYNSNTLCYGFATLAHGRLLHGKQLQRNRNSSLSFAGKNHVACVFFFWKSLLVQNFWRRKAPNKKIIKKFWRKEAATGSFQNFLAAWNSHGGIQAQSHKHIDIGSSQFMELLLGSHRFPLDCSDPRKIYCTLLASHYVR